MASAYVLSFKLIGISSVLLILAYMRWTIFMGSPLLMKMEPQSKMMKQKYSSITSDQWIVVTTVSDPTPDIKFLAEIPGWKVVVVGDTKTPRNWSYPNCVFLNIEDQRSLGFETVRNLPEKSYARKSVGYLYAMSHGAKIIYETDDDNRPLDMLHNFVLEPTMWGLLYSGQGLFNPYRHFGQPTLWPRGYPLSAVGENITTNYLLNHWKTPSIQQGVVNGDPDMDAIFRLTRKQTFSVLNVSFDGSAPPAIVPAGVFSPFNSQNTLFLYDALWALLIPTTTSFRVCDIWRGYWAQRLLWEMGGNLGFFPPNAFQKRNSHSYLLDAMDEKDLYFESERLVSFLKQWKCDTTKPFFDCVTQLSADMAVNGFWKEGDAQLTKAWIKDLKALGYREPGRVNRKLQEGARVIEGKVLPLQSRVTSQMTNLTFWAAEQLPPLQYSPEPLNKPLVSHVTRIHSYCKEFLTSVPPTDITARIKTFPNVLLIVVFSHPHYYGNLHFLQTMYSMHFPHIAYCGSKKATFDKYARLLLQPVTFIEVDVGGGWFAQNCLTQAMKMNYNVDGYLYIGDDTLLNVWNLHQLPWNQFWLGLNAKILRQSRKASWPWYKRPVGLAAYQEALTSSTSLDKQRLDSFVKMLTINTRYPDGFYKAPSDIAYVPERLKDDVVYFLEHFSRFNLFVEIAIPTVFAGLEKWGNIYKIPGNYLWYDGKRRHAENFFHKNLIFLHPLKITKVFTSRQVKKFLCESYLPLTMRGSR